VDRQTDRHTHRQTHTDTLVTIISPYTVEVHDSDFTVIVKESLKQQ